MGRTKAVPVKFASKNVSSLDTSKKSRARSVTRSFTVFPPNNINADYYLGNIWLGISNNVLPQEWQKCKVSFINNDDTLHLKMEFDGSIVVLICVSDDEDFIKGLFQFKLFAMKFNNMEDKISVELHIAELPLPKINKSISQVIRIVFARIFNIEFCEVGQIKEHKTCLEEIDSLYQHVSAIRNKSISLPEYVQHPSLKPQLRSYQQNAVSWMKLKEQPLTTSEELHPLYQPLCLSTKKVIYYSKYLGDVQDEKPLMSQRQTGGILADEMGLGKTVEVLACILSNPMASMEVTGSNSASPKIIRRPPKRERQPTTCDSKYHCSPKKLKVPEDWVKLSSRKSSVRVALECFYESALEEMVISNRGLPKLDQNKVQCICGDTDMVGSIMCVNCLKYQHSKCMGFRAKYGEYRCPKCWTEQPLLESKATLIICPTTLQTQWCDEICKHISASMKVLVYEGSKAASIYPAKLKDYDLVLTTYQVLQAELYFTETKQAPALRREQRYLCPGCPLTLIKWWRLCIDEAQTVEIPTAMISVMVKKLFACHRWAITGTPITRDIFGFYGLIDYLQLSPYSDLETWNHLLYYPHSQGNNEPLYTYLAEIMWRSAKYDVVGQINIPKQTLNEYIIEFSAVEKFYYRREHELCTNQFLDKLKNYSGEVLLSSLDRSSIRKIMAPLLSIRQACNHPNTARGRYLGASKSVKSMEGLLDALIEKNNTDSEENLRIVVSALNGLAGIYLLLQNPLEATEHYRQVMQLAARFNNEEDKKQLTIDKLQLIHTMHNLAEIIETYPNMPPTLRDQQLRQDCLNLQEKYLEKYITQSSRAYYETDALMNTVWKLEEKYILETGEWYTRLTHWVIRNQYEVELQKRITSSLTTESSNTKKLKSHGLELLYELAAWDDELIKFRKKTIQLVSEMYSSEDGKKIEIDENLIFDAMECHLRPEKKSKKVKKCLVCRVSVQMRNYESVLFDMESKSAKADISNKGSWKPSPQELILRALLNFAKTKDAEDISLTDGDLYFRILYKKKIEFKQMRKFWTLLDQQICALDEINMCKTRLSLKVGDEQENKKSTSKTDRILKHLSMALENKLQYINFIEEHELNYQVSILKNEEKVNMASLERNLGIHSYLETLRLQQYAGQSPDPCPICKNALQEHWSILPCGHCYCLECIQVLFEKANIRLLPCSICRQSHKPEDVSYIRTDAVESQVEETKIKGNYSTKIEAIVKLIINLKKEESTVKVLVFSTWVEVLKVMRNALINNGISTELLSIQSLKKCLAKFKNGEITALLLPISLGSKGLNLIEATHVVLTEPLLNPADELQAIGRIHRIGQTKPTIVHKFVVKSTIEESLYQATNQNAANWDKKDPPALNVEADSILEANEDIDANCSIDHSNEENLELQEPFTNSHNSESNISDTENSSSSESISEEEMDM
uniref:RING-type domain-containing protein n=3 Tax=Photinus pyralis TaxID=7054 RepID=A0A1Y1LAC0_PHOPY